MYTQLKEKELIEMIRGMVTELRKRSPKAIEQGLEIIYGLSPDEIIKQQKQAGLEAIKAIREKQEEEIRQEEMRKAARKHEKNEKMRKQIAAWTKKKNIALKVQGILGTGFSLNVWIGSDKRVYLNGRNYKKATYYATGNKWNPPGKLELEKIDLTGDQQEQLIRVCRQAAELWKETRFDIDATVAWQAPPPL